MSFVAGWLDQGTGLELDGGAAYVADGVVGLVTTLVLLLPSLAVGVRRLHDPDRSGWWMLLLLVPCLGFLVLVVFWAIESQSYPDTHGEPPVRTGPPR